MSHCVHFGVCGGCAVDDPHAIDKRALLASALRRAGYENPAIAPLVEIPPYARRRADFAARRGNGGLIPARQSIDSSGQVAGWDKALISRAAAPPTPRADQSAFSRIGLSLGLHKARGAEVVDMRECLLLDPRILALLPALRDLLRGLQGVRRAASVVINQVDNGADLLLRADAPLSLADRRKLIAFAQAHDLPRISIARENAPPEPVVIRSPPVITLSGIPVAPPPGAFLQPSEAGEAAIIGAVLDALPEKPEKAPIVELYAGIGTLTFALARRVRVEAYEGNAPAVAAQEHALRRHNLDGRIKLTRRDLARRPLQPAELKGRPALVLNPPYGGAAAQMRFLAAAGIPRVIYISCNPQALAADAALLRAAGYRLLSATPVDQFPYSENLEAIAVFAR